MAKLLNMLESLQLLDNPDAIFYLKDGIRAGYCLQEGLDQAVSLVDLLSFYSIPTKAHDFCTKKFNYSSLLPKQSTFSTQFTLFSTQLYSFYGGFPLPPAGRAWQS